MRAVWLGLLAALGVGGCVFEESDDEEFSSTLTDQRDGQTYSLTRIGSQVWMAENLNYSGDDGAGGRTFQWGWCYGVGGSDLDRREDSVTCDNGVGRLYTGVEIMAHSNICPKGSHLPDTAEMRALMDFIGQEQSVNPEWIAGHLKAKEFAVDSVKEDAWDTYGFSAKPVGYRNENGDWSRFRMTFNIYLDNEMEEFQGNGGVASMNFSDGTRHLNGSWNQMTFGFSKRTGTYSVRCVVDP